MLLIMKYTLLRSLRNKSNNFWILLFPILLGCMFKVAFSNLGNAESFDAIPVAIVREEGEAADTFCAFADELGKEGDDQMLVITYCGEEEALELLENKEVTGILYAGNAEITSQNNTDRTSEENAAQPQTSSSVRLTISSNMNTFQTNQSILKTLVERYNLNAAILQDTAQNHPEKLPDLISSLQEKTSLHEEVSLSYSSGDTYTQYFYNLIAMACLYTAMSGISVALGNQGNQTALAARKNISAISKLSSIIGELITNVLFSIFLNMIAFFFLILVLRVDLTTRLPLALLAIFVGTLMSVSMGFLFGAIGNKSETFKIVIMFAFVMPCCFLSGLMIGDMRIIVETYAPLINRINPAALISDCFYSLNTYESLQRYTTNILTLVILTILFIGSGFILTRRKRYASL